MNAPPGGTGSGECRFVLASGATFKTVGGRPALYRSADRSLHVLSPTAELLCRCLERPATLDELTDRLAERTDGDRSTIARDLAEIVPDFVDRRILVRLSRQDPDLAGVSAP